MLRGMNTTNTTTLGHRLRTARRARGLSIAALAEAAAIAPETVADIEHGRVQRPRPATLGALAQALAVTATWLQDGDRAEPADRVTSDLRSAGR
jgi:transcriptional regulator with XRE-family HTH domain